MLKINVLGNFDSIEVRLKIWIICIEFYGNTYPRKWKKSGA